VVRVSALPRFLTEEDLMSGNIPAGGLAVMQSRRDPVDSLDFFPTPPWATRALCEIVLPELRMPIKGACVWEPACGAGHMAEVLKEYALMVWASDVHAYPGYETALGSFVGEGPDVIAAPPAGHDGCADRFDWIITNPPFNLAEDFAERALREARNVAFLVRTSWLEGGARFNRIFGTADRPYAIAQFCERVPMVKGRWDPQASTATSYCWVIWRIDRIRSAHTRFLWIPPGQRSALTKPDDVQRFAQSEAS
jgi:predicted RNA methylase